ncbi:MAG: hypothetical protein NTW97_07500 [Candidatus Krumholzibacteria bacterium]|nr:hypothetical protein [Candidatus Krumholzibacteria bacterium]
MRNYCIAILLILATIAPEGCIFEPRTAETPETGTDLYPWIVPNRPKDVFANLASGVASNRDSNYERSLDSLFTFIPSVEAEEAYRGRFADWTKTVELDVLGRIKTTYLGARSAQFGYANLRFDSEDEVGSVAHFRGPYTITLNRGDGSPAQIYAGEAIFTIIQGTQGWVLFKWEDIQPLPGGNPTSGMLRGALR